MEQQKIPKINLIPFELYDISDFIYGDFRKINPILNEREYDNYWADILDVLINGMWGRDYDLKKKKGGYRWMSGDLWNYRNMYKIRVQKNPTDKEGVLDLPFLRSFDWFFDYCGQESSGFSGFEYDTKNTCNNIVGKIQYGLQITNEEKIILDYSHDNVVNKKNGKYKNYIHPREYLFQTFNEPLGRPLFENPASSFVFLTTRRLGKSYHALNKGYKGILTNGAKSVESYMKKDTSYIFALGSFGETYTKENYEKFFDSWNELYNFGLYKDSQTGEEFCNPFWIPFNGSQKLGEWMSTKNKEKGGKKDVGVNNQIGRFNFIENESALVGPAPSFFFGEEFGTWTNPMGVYGKVKPALGRDTQFAPMWFGGTGGEMKKSAFVKPIFYQPSMFNAISFKNAFDPLKPDTALMVPEYYRKILYYNELGNFNLDGAFEDSLINREVERKKGMKSYLEHIQQFPMIDDDIFSQDASGVLPVDFALERKAQLPPVEKRYHFIGKIERNKGSRRTFLRPLQIMPIVKKEDLKDATDFQKSGIVGMYEPPIPGNTYVGFYDSIKDINSGSSMAVAGILKMFGDRYLRGNIVCESIYRINDLDKSDDVFLNMILHYGCKGMPEINLPNILQYTKRPEINLYDLLLPFPLTATNLMVKVDKPKEPRGYYVYPTMKQKYLTRWVSDFLLMKIDGDYASVNSLSDTEIDSLNLEEGEHVPDRDFIYDGTVISETMSEYMLDEIIDFRQEDNADYLSMVFGMQIYIKELIATGKLYQQPDHKVNDNYDKIMQAVKNMKNTQNKNTHGAFKR